MTFKEPMLAAPLLAPDVEHTDEVVYEAMSRLRYPVLATLKKDGIRALRLNGTLLSRRLKPIPNRFICNKFKSLPAGFDMELWKPGMDYNDIQSIVMSEDHPDSCMVECHVLDWFAENIIWQPYIARIDAAHYVGGEYFIQHPVECKNADELFEYEKFIINQCGEGICFRTPDSPYKQGRSTLKEQWLVKLSRFSRDEAVVIGFKEQMENGNKERRDGRGHMNRSTYAHLMRGKNTLGAFIVRNKEGQVFPIGTGVGLTDKLRKHVWQMQDSFLGRTLTYKCKAHGRLLLPRQPIFVGWRNEGE